MNKKTCKFYMAISFLFVFIMCQPNMVYAKKNIPKYRSELKELALMYCLNINYEKLGIYKKDDMKDFSPINYSFNANDGEAISLDTPEKLYDFVEKNTGRFYTYNASIYVEEILPPYNTVFASCMEFYRSNKLKNYINKIKFY